MDHQPLSSLSISFAILLSIIYNLASVYVLLIFAGVSNLGNMIFVAVLLSSIIS